MKLKLLQSGWTTFTGNFGGVEFVDGTSATDVAPVLAKQLANIIQVELEDGTNPSASQQALDSRTYVPIANTLDMQGYSHPAATAPAVHANAVYGREQLEAIASEKGLKGLRDIATPLGIKATSIASMIDSLLNYWSGKAEPERTLDPVDQQVADEDVAAVETDAGEQQDAGQAPAAE